MRRILLGTFISFLFFSALEGIGIYFITMAMFRLKPFKHINAFIPYLAVMILQSYFLRAEVDFSFISPVVSLMLFILFFTLYLRIPLVWSCIITIVCYTAFGCIQWLMLELLFGSVKIMNQTQHGGYLLQSITAAVEFFTAFILIRFRIGFIADFDKLRIKLEKFITIGMIILALVGLALVSFNIKAMIIVTLSFVYFLYFAIRKEME